jgi:hypothetical protein
MFPPWIVAMFGRARAPQSAPASEAAQGMPAGPWVQRWNGSPPEKGDSVFCYGERIAYLGDQYHDAVSRLVYQHNVAVGEAAVMAREFVDYLAVNAPELRAVKVPELADLWMQFLWRREQRVRREAANGRR